MSKDTPQPATPDAPGGVSATDCTGVNDPAWGVKVANPGLPPTGPWSHLRDAWEAADTSAAFDAAPPVEPGPAAPAPVAGLVTSVDEDGKWREGADEPPLPCPWCGTTHLLTVEPLPENGFLVVKCRKCGASGRSRLANRVIEAQALWNDRAALTAGAEPRATDAGWSVVKADDAPVWADGIVTDGERVAMAQKAEADYGETYWAIDDGEGALDWEPTHFISREALRPAAPDADKPEPRDGEAECENCDGEGTIEYEGGDGEGWPSKPERDTCLKCRGTGRISTPDARLSVAVEERDAVARALASLTDPAIQHVTAKRRLMSMRRATALRQIGSTEKGEG